MHLDLYFENNFVYYFSKECPLKKSFCTRREKLLHKCETVCEWFDIRGWDKICTLPNSVDFLND